MLAAVLAPVLLAGCGGTDEPPATARSPHGTMPASLKPGATGASKQIGVIDVIQARIVAGSPARVTATVSNTDLRTAHELTKITGPTGSTVTITGKGVALPPTGFVTLGASAHRVTYRPPHGTALRAGQRVPLTFTFAGSGAGTLRVPVIAPAH